MMARRVAVWAGAAVCLSGVAAMVPGCFQPGFQFYFMNVGDYPAVRIAITPEDGEDTGENGIEAPVLPGGAVMIPGRFATGGVYDVLIAFDTDPTTQEDPPGILRATVDTSALNEGYVTLYASLRREGANGAGYYYGLPD